jgi:bloom syndrome protein
VASDDEDESFFEPVQERRRREETPQLGPPITNDERMANLPELHRVFIDQFVEEANREMEKIRNARNLKKPIFTEANLREMAINWTITLDDMAEVPDINTEAVKMWGRKFLPIIQRFSANYEVAMNDYEDRDIDKNHQNVIDLCSEDEEDENEYGMNDSDEEAIMEAEQGSKYFQTQTIASSFKKQGQSSRTLPCADDASSYKPAAPRKAYGRGGFSFKSKRRKKSGGRKSGSSASGQSHAGVTRRKTSGAAKAPAAAKKSAAANGNTNLMTTFGNHGTGWGCGGVCGGGGGGGIRIMPT